MSESVQILNIVSECFELWVPTGLSSDQFEMELHRLTVLRVALNDLLAGNMSLSDYLEFVDFLNIDIDNYLDEVEENLESTPLYQFTMKLHLIMLPGYNPNHREIKLLHL